MLNREVATVFRCASTQVREATAGDVRRDTWAVVRNVELVAAIPA
jgi:hypothetical protein